MSIKIYVASDGNRIQVPSSASLIDWPGYTEEETSLIDMSIQAREWRDILLSDTDWWAVADRPMTTDQADYRQALRDITGQSGFPTDITWPTKPE